MGDTSPPHLLSLAGTCVVRTPKLSLYPGRGPRPLGVDLLPQRPPEAPLPQGTKGNTEGGGEKAQDTRPPPPPPQGAPAAPWQPQEAEEGRAAWEETRSTSLWPPLSGRSCPLSPCSLSPLPCPPHPHPAHLAHLTPLPCPPHPSALKAQSLASNLQSCSRAPHTSCPTPSTLATLR